LCFRADIRLLEEIESMIPASSYDDISITETPLSSDIRQEQTMIMTTNDVKLPVVDRRPMSSLDVQLAQLYAELKIEDSSVTSLLASIVSPVTSSPTTSVKFISKSDMNFISTPRLANFNGMISDFLLFRIFILGPPC